MLKLLPVTYNAPVPPVELPLMNFIPFMVMLFADMVSIFDFPCASSVAILSGSVSDPPIIVKLFLSAFMVIDADPK